MLCDWVKSVQRNLHTFEINLAFVWVYGLYELIKMYNFFEIPPILLIIWRFHCILYMELLYFFCIFFWYLLHLFCIKYILQSYRIPFNFFLFTYWNIIIIKDISAWIWFYQKYNLWMRSHQNGMFSPIKNEKEIEMNILVIVDNIIYISIDVSYYNTIRPQILT